MPVSQMGNYQEYLKRMPSPLREVESTPVRQHMFGNPFKIDKVIFYFFTVLFLELNFRTSNLSLSLCKVFISVFLRNIKRERLKIILIKYAIRNKQCIQLLFYIPVHSILYWTLDRAI